MLASQNEVVLNDDWLGFNQNEVIDNTYLTLETPEMTTQQVELTDPFKLDLFLMLSNHKYHHKRSLVTFLEVIGNVGGFNDAVWLLFSSFLSSYSAIMYMRSISMTTLLRSSKREKRLQLEHSKRNLKQKTKELPTADAISTIDSVQSK